MSVSVPFPVSGRRRRSWVSFTQLACLYDRMVLVTYRAPVVGGVVLYHLAWQHVMRWA